MSGNSSEERAHRRYRVAGGRLLVRAGSQGFGTQVCAFGPLLVSLSSHFTHTGAALAVPSTVILNPIGQSV